MTPKQFFQKMRGGKHCPPRAPWSEMISSTIGAFLGIAAIYYIGHLHELRIEDSLFLVGSFGASAVLIYGVPNSPYAQPRNLIGGHILSATIGVSAVYLLPGNIMLSAAVAVSLAIFCMHYFRVIHPPGGATALIAVIGGSKIHGLGYWYVLTPIALGAVVMLVVAVIVNNLTPGRRYPQYWV
jgi:CBS-domain-containing membrane protein